MKVAAIHWSGDGGQEKEGGGGGVEKLKILLVL